MDHLKEIQELLKGKIGGGVNVKYSIPSLWADQNFSKEAGRLSVNPYEFFSRQIEQILREPPHPILSKNLSDTPGEGGEWSRKAVVYNLSVRLTTAFDHNQNEILDMPANSDGFRETGTFLKTIALLPYIKRLGANTIHLLPITSIGQDGKKGSLGSPYAIRNPYHLDENLCEPFLGVGVEKEFKAFVEAAHHMGISVIVEFVFRTASKDSDWVKEHPDWFYWIKESIADRSRGSLDETQYGSPIFTKELLKKISEKISRDNYSDSVAPSSGYQGMFTATPSPENISKEGERWIGVLSDGTRVKIPGAFADWPPDDPQPPWNDVTYLKLYQHPEFNYIAYNTVRMYDTELARPENSNRLLCDTIANIIPHYQKEFNIDGVMVDMGHALPHGLFKDIVSRARQNDPHFAFWEENFTPTAKSRECGYNAAIGYIWLDIDKPHKVRDILERYAREKFPIPFFGTSESHNSPRAATYKGEVQYSKCTWGINSFLPVIPFIHSGFELGEKFPVNTGLNFTEDELKKYTSEKLPLFSEAALDWMSKEQFCGWIEKVARLREKYAGLVSNPEPSSLRVLYPSGPELCAFERVDAGNRLFIFANINPHSDIFVEIPIPDRAGSVGGLISNKPFEIGEGKIKFSLQPWEVQIIKAQ